MAYPDDELDPAPLLTASLPPKTKVARIRPAKFAGRMYPADPAELRRQAAELVAGPEAAPGSPRALGLVLPHGPWTHVGRLVGDALRAGPVEETVVVLGPNHLGRGPRGAIVCDGAFALPGGGTVPIEQTLAESVRGLGGLTEAPELFADDHAIETLLPILLAAQPRLCVVPVALHDVAPPTAARIGAAIADAVVGRGGGATLVATTDVAHYVAPESLAAATDAIVDRTAALDDEGLVAAIRARMALPGPVIETCGLGALLTFVHAMRALGADPGKVVGRGASSDVDGPDAAAVAYASIAYLR